MSEPPLPLNAYGLLGLPALWPSQPAPVAGCDWSVTWLYQDGNPSAPVDLTGKSARLMIRPYPGAPVLLSLTTVADANGSIQLQQGLSTAEAQAAGVLGWVTVTITNAATTLLGAGTFGVSLLLDNVDGTTTPLLTGQLSVSSD